MKSNAIVFGVLALSIFLASILLHWLVGLCTVAGFVWVFKWRPRTAAVAGLLATFLIWGGFAFYLSSQNEHQLAGRIGQLFGGLSPILLAVITGLLGGVAGGLVGWSAGLFNRP